MNKPVLLFFGAAVLCLAAGPFVGTWKPNPTKWKESPGSISVARRSQLLSFDATGKDQYHVTRTLPSDNTKTETDWILDGKERKSSRTDGNSSSERIDTRHIRTKSTYPKGSVTNDFEVSADGKVLTVTSKGIGSTTGRAVDDLYVYDKQTEGKK